MNLTPRERELLFSPTSPLTALDRGALALLLLATGEGVDVKRIGRTHTFESEYGTWDTVSAPVARMAVAGMALGLLKTSVVDGRTFIVHATDDADAQSLDSASSL